MRDEPTNNNGSSELAFRLPRLRIAERLNARVGSTATHAFTKTQTILKKPINIPRPSRFVRSLTALRPKSLSVDKEQLKNNLINAIEQSNEELAKATTVFPLKFFPDTITLDRTKITITRRSFLSANVMSIRVEDILNVSGSVNPFFGCLTIATRVLSSDDHFTVRHLWRDDVINLKHMIQGYVIAKQNNLACDHLSRDELIDTLEELGHDSHTHKRLRTVA